MSGEPQISEAKERTERGLRIWGNLASLDSKFSRLVLSAGRLKASLSLIAAPP